MIPLQLTRYTSEDQMRRERESKCESGREKGNRALAVDYETLAASPFSQIHVVPPWLIYFTLLRLTLNV
jgi:hypothetical protein